MQKPKSDIRNNRKLSHSQDKSGIVKTEDQQSPSYWEMMIEGIVRPPRAKYQQHQLGTKIISYKNRFFVRNEYNVLHENKKIQLTVFSSCKKPNYIILYMHGNSSCRVESLTLLRFIPEDVSLASFDFMGCGKNEQMETISLGYRQSAQAATVADYLRKLDYKVILWGRSMGAATSLLYGKAEMIIADSSYKSFKSLCKQVAKEHSPVVVPNCMITCFFPCVFSKLKKDVDKRAKYDVEDLDVKEAVKRLDPQVQVVFMSGDKDVLIMPRNSQKLHDLCPCKKKHIKLFDGDHNSKRPETVMKDVMKLVKDHIDEKKKLQEKEIAQHEIVLNIEEETK